MKPIYSFLLLFLFAASCNEPEQMAMQHDTQLPKAKSCGCGHESSPYAMTGIGIPARNPDFIIKRDSLKVCGSDTTNCVGVKGK